MSEQSPEDVDVVTSRWGGAAWLRSVRVGAVVVEDAGQELFAQGHLRIHRRPGGFVVFVAGRAAAFVDEFSHVVDAVVIDESARELLEDVVLVAALTLVERLRGRFHVHAGLVVDADGTGTLIGGVGGAGKTTTSLAFAHAGAVLVGDDVGFLSSPDQLGAVCMQSLRRPLHVGDATLSMFPHLLARVRPGARTAAGKRVVDVDPVPHEPVRLVRLLFPSISTRPTHATRLKPSEVLAQLLVTSASVAWPTVPGATAHLAALRALVDVDAWSVVLGPDAVADPGRIVAAIR
jgi:hypothetical protein